jgi:hypothetical protein
MVSELRDAINVLITGLILFPVAFIMATFLAALPFDTLFLWTMKQFYKTDDYADSPSWYIPLLTDRNSLTFS